jgi:hypothetical protein
LRRVEEILHDAFTIQGDNGKFVAERATMSAVSRLQS